MNQLTEHQLLWIKTNQLLFTSSITWNKQLIDYLFEILSHLTGKDEKPTSCGRCVATARDKVWAQYKRQTNDIKEINN